MKELTQSSLDITIDKENELETPLKKAIIEHKILKELKRRENIVEI
jgi:hypothetical protein